MKRQLTLIAILLTTLSSCQQQSEPQKSRADLIEEGIQVRVEQLKRRRMQRCAEELLQRVIAEVDSTIASELKLEMVDTIAFPNRPIRPRVPGGKILLDTSPVTKVLPDY